MITTGRPATSRPAAEDPRPRPRAGGIRFRRPLGEAVLHAPHTLRALVRADEIWLVVLAAAVGVGGGLMVSLMTWMAQFAHEVLFDLTPGTRLSGATGLDPWRAVLVPSLGGLAFGLALLVMARFWAQRMVDPIEANALYGGRVPLGASVVLMFQTVFSNGVGASVGLEAGYTQISGALGSRLGHIFRVRRNDLRLLVGCGAAAGIAGAFDAPLTGAFFAFELVIGTYTLAALAPVICAAIVSVGVTNLIGTHDDGLALLVPSRIEAVDYLPILALGMICALVGIAIMRGVTITEGLFRRSGVPGWARPAIGGLAVGLLALITPQVLSAGHGAMAIAIHAPYSLTTILMLIVLKAVASAISLGSGFRGGLFYASLFLGALLGKLFAGVMVMVSTAHAVPEVVCAMVGMSALAVAVVGGPLTMAFLALETTGSLPMTAAVLAAVVVSSLTVRRTFGYSFATWRFHLRGEAIRSAVDVGWMRSLTVGRMMRREVRTVRASMSPADFRRDFPLGSMERVIALDDDDRYAGIVWVAEAHGDNDPSHALADLLHHRDVVLLPEMGVKDTTALFETAEADALAVVDSEESRNVIGLLTEQHTLRRYAEELERRRRELSGE